MDAIEQFRLPLFPLPVVLFPTAVMPLHIFEPRYRQMVARCLEGDRTFGLIYHDADVQGPFLLEPGRVGCLARIGEFEPLDDGRSILMAHGTRRFVIRDGIESEEPYYEALVSPYPDLEPREGIDVMRRRSLGLFQDVVEALPEDPEGLPPLDPSVEISFPLVRTIQVDAAWQQSFLELRDEAQRLDRLNAIFRAALG